MRDKKKILLNRLFQVVLQFHEKINLCNQKDITISRKLIYVIIMVGTILIF